MFTESAVRSVMSLLAVHILCPGFADFSPAAFHFHSSGSCRPALVALHPEGSRQRAMCVLLLPGGRTAQNPRWDGFKKSDLLHLAVLAAFGIWRMETSVVCSCFMLQVRCR